MRLPKFADGGMVSRSVINNLSIPSMGARAGAMGNDPKSTVVLDFGKLGRFETEAKQDVAQKVLVMFQRAAMQKGRR